MSMPRPRFDPKRFIEVRCDASRIPPLRAALIKLSEALRARRRSDHRRLLLLFLIIVVTLVGLKLASWSYFAPAGALSLLAVGYGYALMMASALFKLRDPPMPRIISAFLLVNPGLFLYLGAAAAFGEVASSFDLRQHPAPTLVAIAVSSAVVYVVKRLVAWNRVKRVEPQRLEVDYLARIAQPILRDLGPGARATLVFNPFRSEWSRVRVPTPRARIGYTIKGFADLLLSLELPLEGPRGFKLSVVEHSREKIKDRKNKYKGTKRVLVYRYVLEGISGAPGDLTPALASHLAKALSGWKQELETRDGYFAELPPFGQPATGSVKTSARVRDGRLVVTQCYKTASPSRELRPEHLLPPSMVLATVGFVGRAAVDPPRETG